MIKPTIHRLEVLQRFNESIFSHKEEWFRMKFVRQKDGSLRTFPKCRKYIPHYDYQKGPQRLNRERTGKGRASLYHLNRIDALFVKVEGHVMPRTVLIDTIVEFEGKRVVY